jgi:expansin (peptidoglycan-binding protein)
MADLVTTISETVTLNGSLRGSVNSVTTTGINDVFERIVTCTASVVTTVAVFDTLPSTSAGAIDVDRTKYVRVTNLETAVDIELAVQTTTSSYTVTVRAGGSHVLYSGDVIALGEVGAPTFGTMLNLASLQVQPTTAVTARVEVFVGVE